MGRAGGRPLAGRLGLWGIGILTVGVVLHILAPPVAGAIFRPPRTARTPADLGMSYRDRTLSGAGRTRLPSWHVSGRGDGPGRALVILLAENGGSRASSRLLGIAARIAERGADVLLLDPRGHGDSSGINTYGLGETKDLLAVLRFLRAEAPGRPLLAAGLSLGATCILKAMSVSDALEGAVVFAPYARLDAELIRHELEHQTRGLPAATLARRLVSARLLRLSVGLWAGFPGLPEPQDLTTGRPVHLFHATGDPEIPYRNALDIVERARAPGLVLHPVARDVHLPWLADTQVWEEFSAELGALVDSVTTPGQ